jgi:hypothetical protein
VARPEETADHRGSLKSPCGIAEFRKLFMHIDLGTIKVLNAQRHFTKIGRGFSCSCHPPCENLSDHGLSSCLKVNKSIPKRAHPASISQSMNITPETDAQVRGIVSTMCRATSIDEITNLVLSRLLPKQSLEKPLEHFVRKTVRLEGRKDANKARQRQRRQQSLPPSGISSLKAPLAMLVEQEERRAIRDECSRLSEKEFDAIKGFFHLDHSGLSAAEFAVKWNCGPKEIYRCKDAALGRLKCAIRKRGLDD